MADDLQLLVYPHRYYECPGGDSHREGACTWCDGGLSYCEVCGAFEGQLLVNCPGFKLGEEALEACYQSGVRGGVVDLCGPRRYLKKAPGGRWVRRGVVPDLLEGERV